MGVENSRISRRRKTGVLRKDDSVAVFRIDWGVVRSGREETR